MGILALLVYFWLIAFLSTHEDFHGQNSSAHVACVVVLQTDAVVVTETRFSYK